MTPSPALRVAPPEPNVKLDITDAIPELLKRLQHWLYFDLTPAADGKLAKDPQRSDGRGHAKCDAPRTWTTFPMAATAVAARPGRVLGFAVTLDSRIVTVDIDHCIDPQTGEINSRAREIVAALHSYTEISPSGTGMHIWCFGTLPPDDRKKGHIEMYDSGRMMTVTGNHLEGTPTTIEERTAELGQLHAEVFGTTTTNARSNAHPPASVVDLADGELLEAAFANPKNGREIRSLWEGDTSAHGDDDSAADQALCNHLAYYTGGDAGRIDSIFRQSGLYRPKWDRADYRERTIKLAIDGCTGRYVPYPMPTNGNGHHIEPAMPTIADAGIVAVVDQLRAEVAELRAENERLRAENREIRELHQRTLAVHANPAIHGEGPVWVAVAYAWASAKSRASEDGTARQKVDGHEAVVFKDGRAKINVTAIAEASGTKYRSSRVYIKAGEDAGLWRRVPEWGPPAADGQPTRELWIEPTASDLPELLAQMASWTQPETEQRGGRADRGKGEMRCLLHPDAPVIQRVTTEFICSECGVILEEETRTTVLEDEDPPHAADFADKGAVPLYRQTLPHGSTVYHDGACPALDGGPCSCGGHVYEEAAC